MKELKEIMKEYKETINESFDNSVSIIDKITEQLGEGRFDIPEEKQFYTHCDCSREKILAIEVKDERLFLWADIMIYNVQTLPFWEQWEIISKLYDVFVCDMDAKHLE